MVNGPNHLVFLVVGSKELLVGKICSIFRGIDLFLKIMLQIQLLNAMIICLKSRITRNVELYQIELFWKEIPTGKKQMIPLIEAHIDTLTTFTNDSKQNR